jgi:ABC-2 type transport system permease protein
MIGQATVYLTTSMVTGIAFGAVLLASAPAIALYLALPIAWSALALLSPLEHVAPWLDPAVGPISGEVLSATQWAHAGTALAVWMLLPLVVGVWRITRREVVARPLAISRG